MEKKFKYEKLLLFMRSLTLLQKLKFITKSCFFYPNITNNFIEKISSVEQTINKRMTKKNR